MIKGMVDRIALVHSLEEQLRHPDYETDYFASSGLHKLFVGGGTLGPEMSWVAQHFTEYLLKHQNLYRGKMVLDMGSGSGVQAVAVILGGAASVVAVDISPYAIRSIQENRRRFDRGNMECVQSDLFTSLAEQRFGVILFNHPFLAGIPRDRVEGIYVTPEETLCRFFRDARTYVERDGFILMPFAHLGDHNPEKYAARLNYRIIFQENFSNQFGNHSIYCLQPQ